MARRTVLDGAPSTRPSAHSLKEVTVGSMESSAMESAAGFGAGAAGKPAGSRTRGHAAPAKAVIHPSRRGVDGSFPVSRSYHKGGRSTATGTTLSCHDFSRSASGHHARAGYGGTGDQATYRAARCSSSTSSGFGACRNSKEAGAACRCRVCKALVGGTTDAGNYLQRSLG